jgi:hypothetical protein
VKILLCSLLFLAPASSAVGSLIKSYYFVTEASVCAIRKVPSIPLTKLNPTVNNKEKYNETRQGGGKE